MRYVKKIMSTLKNHTEVTDLGPKTLILGPNKAGKSAIVNALEFVLTATVSDVVGRPLVKEMNRLLSLARDGASIYASASLDDDSIVTCATKGKKAIWEAQPGCYNPSTVFPLRSVREALAGNTETTRRFFIRFVAGGVTDEDVINEIPKPLHKRYQQALAATPKAAAVDALLSAMTTAKERHAAVKAEIATRKDIMAEAGQGLAPPPSEQQLAMAVAKELQIAQDIRQMEHDLAMEQGREEQRAQFVKLKSQREEIEQAMTDVATRLADARENWPAQPGANDDLRLHHLAVLQFAQAKSLDTCPTCKRPVEEAQILWDTRVETVDRAAVEAKDRVEAYEKHQALVNDLEIEWGTLQHDHDKIEGLREGNGQMSVPIDMVEFEQKYDKLKLDLEAARNTLRSMEQAQAAWDPIKRARDSAAEKEVELDEWRRLIDALKTATSRLLDKAKDAFVARVQAFMPKGDVFGLVLRDDDREVCQYGFLRDGRLYEAASGVEWAYVTAAIAAASIPPAEKDKLHVIVFEDRAWDIDTLGAVCDALAKVEAQVIIATTPPMDWQGGAPDDWTLVDLTGDEKPRNVIERVLAHEQPNGPHGLEDHERDRIEVERLGKLVESLSDEIKGLKEERRKAGAVEEVLDPVQKTWTEVPAPPEKVRKPRVKKEKPPAPVVDPGMPPELE
jgi:hypothetical protein